jgi:sulfite exporter TauE/SafE
MSAELLIPVAAASLIGSVHCAGMCGGFVAIVGDGVTGRARYPTQLVYHFGRLLSYVALGSAAGALGHAVDLAGNAAGIGRIAALATGSLMIVWGLGALLETQGVRVLRGRATVPERITRALASLRQRPPMWRALALGLATTLLPCGWLYAFAVTAAGTASVWRGALLMAAFWAGNLPILFGLGVALSALVGRVRRHVPVLSAAVIFAIGIFTVTTRANLPAFAAAAVLGRQHAPAALPSAADCPCHRVRH